jgi:hypothetical protein
MAMPKLLNRKGVSNLIATMLIILLSIASVGLLWVYVTNTIKPALSPENSCFDFGINPPVKIDSACFNPESENIEIKLTRSFDSTTLNNLNFIINSNSFSNSWSCSNACNTCSILNKGESKKYYFNFDSNNTQNLKVYVQSGNCLIDSLNVKEIC